MNLPFSSRRVAIAGALAAVIAVVAYVAFQPFYDTNDDPAMRLITEGRFVPGAPPLPAVLYMSPLVGKVLAAANGRFPRLPWFDLMLAGCDVTALLVAAVVLVRRARGAVLVTACGALAAFWMTSLIRVQFTVVAGHLAAVGCLVLADGLISARETRRLPWRSAVLATALVIAGALVRWHAAALVTALGLTLTIPFAIPLRPGIMSGARWRALTTSLAIVAALVATRQFEIAYYRSSPGWEQFVEFGLLKASLTEWLSAEQTARAGAATRAATGWSENDLTLFRTWFTSNPQIFSLDKVRQAVDAVHASPSEETLMRKVQILLARAPDTLKRIWLELPKAVLLIAVLVLGVGTWRHAAYALYAVLMIAAAIVLVEVSFKALPFRLMWPLLTLLGVFLTLDLARVEGPSRAAGAISACLAVAAAIAIVVPLREGSRWYADWTSLVRDEVRQIDRSGPHTYVIRAGDFPFEAYVRPFQPTPRDPAFDWVPIGGAAFTPIVQDYFRRSGISDLTLTMCTNDRFRYISAGEPQPIERYVLEHFGIEAKLIPEFQGRVVRTWRCVASAGIH